MTKNEFKILRGKIKKKSQEMKTEIKATQRAIDQRMGDTGRITQKHTELDALLSELKKASH